MSRRLPVASHPGEQCLSPKISSGRRCLLKATHVVDGDVAPLRYCLLHATQQAQLQRSNPVVFA